jgi:hypothetical protein
MSISAQNASNGQNTTLVQQATSMLAHGVHQKGSNEQLGLIQALKISGACVLLLGLAFTALGSHTEAHPSESTTKTVASTVSAESQKARDTSYKQSKPLGTIFADAMGSTIASTD